MISYHPCIVYGINCLFVSLFGLMTKMSSPFVDYSNEDRLVEFLMALTPVFEPIQASLLHRDPLPTLEQVMTELLYEETRLGTLKTTIDNVLAISYMQTPSGSFTQICQYCKNQGLSFSHSLFHCPIRDCRTCHKQGPGHFEHHFP